MTTSVTPGSVVVGVDGSPQSDAALSWAIDYATVRRLPLALVNAAGRVDQKAAVTGTAEARRNLRMAARRVTDQALGAVRRAAPGLRVEVTTPLRDAQETLVALSDVASLVVVGTRGRGPVRSRVLGSVSVGLAERARCPVAVVRSTDPVPAEVPGQGHVVVGVGADGSSAGAVEVGFALASAWRARLDVVHGWDDRTDYLDPDGYQRRLDLVQVHHRVLSEALCGYAARYPDVQVDRRMPDAPAGHVLADMSQGALAVVVGTRGRTGLPSLLGSVSRHLLEHAHSTVLVVGGSGSQRSSASIRAATAAPSLSTGR
jgi:nucleotide-binding universal stress UspA family protein